MPVLSAFSPCGMLACSSQPSHAEENYHQLQQLWGTSFDFTEGTYQEAKLYAWAMGLARAQYELEHGGNQSNPLTAYELVPLLELDFGIVPGPTDTVPTRQKTIAAAELMPLGATASNIVNGLKALVGKAFIAYVPTGELGTSTYNTPTVGVPYGGTAVFSDIRTPARTVKILDPIATGTQWVGYTTLSQGDEPVLLYPGDTIMVQGENSLQREAVQVLATAMTPTSSMHATGRQVPAGTTTWAASTSYGVGETVTPTTAHDNGFFFKVTVAGTSGTTEPTWPSSFAQPITDGSVQWVASGAGLVFQAGFIKSHDIGATATTGNYPFLWSTSRLSYVVLTSAGAADKETRRKVDTFMARVARGVSSWAVVDAQAVTDALVVGAPMGTYALSVI